MLSMGGTKRPLITLILSNLVSRMNLIGFGYQSTSCIREQPNIKSLKFNPQRSMRKDAVNGIRQRGTVIIYDKNSEGDIIVIVDDYDVQNKLKADTVGKDFTVYIHLGNHFAAETKKLLKDSKLNINEIGMIPIDLPTRAKRLEFLACTRSKAPEATPRHPDAKPVVGKVYQQRVTRLMHLKRKVGCKQNEWRFSFLKVDAKSKNSDQVKSFWEVCKKKKPKDLSEVKVVTSKSFKLAVTDPNMGNLAITTTSTGSRILAENNIVSITERSLSRERVLQSRMDLISNGLKEFDEYAAVTRQSKKRKIDYTQVTQPKIAKDCKDEHSMLVIRTANGADFIIGQRLKDERKSTRSRIKFSDESDLRNVNQKVYVLEKNAISDKFVEVAANAPAVTVKKELIICSFDKLIDGKLPQEIVNIIDERMCKSIQFTSADFKDVSKLITKYGRRCMIRKLRNMKKALSRIKAKRIRVRKVINNNLAHCISEDEQIDILVNPKLDLKRMHKGKDERKKKIRKLITDLALAERHDAIKIAMSRKGKATCLSSEHATTLASVIPTVKVTNNLNKKQYICYEVVRIGPSKMKWHPGNKRFKSMRDPSSNDALTQQLSTSREYIKELVPVIRGKKILVLSNF